MRGWIGVDLDGTLAEYSGWKGADHIGEPVPAMAFRVRNWLAQGIEVRIFTARVHEGGRSTLTVEQVRASIETWTEKHFGVVLPVTNLKDFNMVELWDDRAVRVRANEGEPCCEHHKSRA